MVPEALAERIGGRPFAYLVTVGADSAPHLVAVRVEVSGAVVRCADVGSTGRSNAERSARATLLWPPVDGNAVIDDEHRHYSLIADGSASVDDVTVVVKVERAVLHRPA